jgi:hypothetical protein
MSKPHRVLEKRIRRKRYLKRAKERAKAQAKKPAA